MGKSSRFDLEAGRRRAGAVKNDMQAQKTEGGVFNKRTLESVGRLGSKGFIDRIMGPIATGKEADVFLGERGNKKIVIKIFRLSSASYFKKPSVLEYIGGDRRFEKIGRGPRALVRAWVLKEFRNLKKAGELGINSPRPLAMEGNVIVMQYLGEEKAAPQLLNYGMKDAKSMFKQVMGQVRRMYRGGLVHADLSEYNILVLGEKPFLIDFGQAVLLTHPRAEEFLERDVRNICGFFERRGLECDRESALREVRK